MLPTQRHIYDIIVTTRVQSYYGNKLYIPIRIKQLPVIAKLVSSSTQTRNGCETLMPLSIEDLWEENERKPQIIGIFLSQRGITLSKLPQ